MIRSILSDTAVTIIQWALTINFLKLCCEYFEVILLALLVPIISWLYQRMTTAPDALTVQIEYFDHSVGQK